METLQNAADLLKAVYATMDSISVVGFENQDKFVGCGNCIRNVTQVIEKFIQQNQTQKEETDG